MFCLETLLGVQSRIIFANTGAELQSYAHDLVHHFQTHGSPIMIGEFVISMFDIFSSLGTVLIWCYILTKSSL